MEGICTRNTESVFAVLMLFSSSENSGTVESSSQVKVSNLQYRKFLCHVAAIMGSR
jgi:hypothetical protein